MHRLALRWCLAAANLLALTACSLAPGSSPTPRPAATEPVPLVPTGPWLATPGPTPTSTVEPTPALLALNELFRPHYHFTPGQHWMNDPNGLVYQDGEYHLFYQHNPDASVWGPMHWGQAVSADLVNWQHLPIALYPDDLGNIFSGSAVIDADNTAGFGAGAMVAVFTHDSHGMQAQSLAYSTDHGRTWTKYSGNPIIPTPPGQKDFRDPSVFWYGERGSGRWVMALSAGNSIWFYTSPDLKHWTKASEFGGDYGAHTGVWETPDLVQLPIDGGPETRWLLAVATQDGAPAGGSGEQYFVGTFDGQTFNSDFPADATHWADYGADFYAAQSWRNAPGGRHIWAAWMNNWSYANDTPTSTWRGALTLPRELSLAQSPNGLQLVQQPIPELESLRGQHWTWKDQTIGPDSHLLDKVSGDALEIIAEFQAGSADRFGFQVRMSGDQRTTIGYSAQQKQLFIDRQHAGSLNAGPKFPGIHLAPLPDAGNTIRLHIFVDASSVEVFGDDGRVSLTDQIFPDESDTGVRLFAENGQAVLKSLDIYSLKPATVTAPGGTPVP